MPIAVQIGVPVLAILAISIGAIVSYSANATREAAVNAQVAAAEQSIDAFRTLRSYYTSQVVKKVIASGVFEANPSPHGDPHAIPLPATMIHELSQALASRSNGLALKLYSAHPFPGRADRELDPFQREALTALERSSDKPFVRMDRAGGERVVRVAIADTMSAQACVACHNTHPASPKTDWKMGDTRGVLEVAMPIEESLAAAASLSMDTLALGVLALILVTAIATWLVRRAGRGLDASLDAIDRISQGELDVDIEVRGMDEIGRLAVGVNAMSSRLRESLDALHRTGAMTDAAPIGLLFADADLTVRYVNPWGTDNLARLFETDESSPTLANGFVGLPLDEVFPAVCRAHRLDALREPVEMTDEHAGEFISVRIAPLFDRDGHYRGPLLMWEIITGRLQAERERERLIEIEREERQREEQNARNEQEKAERDRLEREQVERRATALQAAMARAAEGDLTLEVGTESGGDAEDPVGRVGDALSGFLHDLRARIAVVDEQAHSLATESEQLNELGSTLSMEAERTTERTLVAGQATLRAREHVDTTRALGERVVESGHEIQSRTGSAALTAERASEAMKLATESIVDLDRTGEEIGEIVNLIDEIADQSALLALNASIESARAGSSGRGFAIVAREIKSLSHQTTAATESVRHLVFSLEQATRRAVESIGGVTSVIEELDASQQGISVSADVQVEATREILQRMADTIQALDTISDSVSQVSTAASGTTERANEAVHAANKLAESASEMREAVRHFRT